MFDSMKFPAVTATILCICVLSNASAGAESIEGDSVATWRDGVITSSDLSSWLAFQGKTNDDVDVTGECKDLLLVSVLAAETEEFGIDEEFSDSMRSIADKILTQRLRRFMASNISISNTEIEAAIKKFPQAFQKPRRLRLRNFFLAFPPDPTQQEKLVVKMQMEEFRQSLVKGEDFAKLAESYSDSQTRFRGGLMGNVPAGQLPKEIDEVAMLLNPGEISPPIQSTQGITLLKCDKVIPATVPTPAEVRSNIEKNLRRIKEKEQWEQVKIELDGDDASNGSFQRRAAKRARELDLDQDPETQAILFWKRKQLLANEALRRRVEKAFTLPSDDEVRTFYESNSTLFMVPESFDLSIINIDVADDLQAAQTLAYRLSYQLRQNEIDFANTATRFSSDPSANVGGMQKEMTRRQLAGRGPEFMKTVLALNPGETSKDFMANGSLWIVRLDATAAKKPRPFNEASENARAKLTQQRVGALQDAIEAEVVGDLDVRVVSNKKDAPEGAPLY